MSGHSTHFSFVAIYLILLITLATCSDPSWRHDPAIEAARNACKSQSGLDYNCIEGQAVAATNPDICRLVGIYIDDMCLQAVYEAADNPAICDRIYLQGVVPNCRAYYALRTPASTSPAVILETPIQTPSPSFTPPPTATLTGISTPIATPTPLFILDLTGYDPDIVQPIDVTHRPPMIARAGDTVRLAFDPVNTIYCTELQRYCQLEPRLYYAYGDCEAFPTIPLTTENVNGHDIFSWRPNSVGLDRSSGARAERWHFTCLAPPSGGLKSTSWPRPRVNFSPLYLDQK